MEAAAGLQIISITDDEGRGNQKLKPNGDQTARAKTGATPFMDHDPPQSREDDDAGHVQRPTGEIVFSHLGLTHAVKEKLEIPDDACGSREQIVDR